MSTNLAALDGVYVTIVAPGLGDAALMPVRRVMEILTDHVGTIRVVFEGAEYGQYGCMISLPWHERLTGFSMDQLDELAVAIATRAVTLIDGMPAGAPVAVWRVPVVNPRYEWLVTWDAA